MRRARGPTSALALNDLRAMRATNCSGRSMQTLPWLKIGGMGDWGALFDRGPSTYWYRVPEVEHELVDAGFEIIAVGVGSEIVRGVICKDGVELQARGAVGTIYSVCRKRE